MFTYLNSLIFQNQIFDNLIYFLAVTLPYILLGAGFLFLLFVPTLRDPMPWIRGLPRRALKSIHVAFTVLIAYGITEFLKYVLHFPRPFEGIDGIIPLFIHSGGDSFPSGHATAFAALAGAIYFHYRSAGVVFWICAILIALSRVIAGVHFPIDIFGGIVVGAVTAFFMNRFWKKISKVTAY